MSAFWMSLFLLLASFPAQNQETTEKPNADTQEQTSEPTPEQAPEQTPEQTAEQIPKETSEPTPKQAPAPQTGLQDEERISGYLLTEEEQEAYNRAATLMLQQNWAAAWEAWGDYLNNYPDGYYARASQDMKKLSELLSNPKTSKAITGSVDRSGRIELMVFSTLYGIWAGGGLGILARLDEVIILTAFLGGGVGLLASILTTSTGQITEGQAATISTGGLWGTWNGFTLANAFNIRGDNEVIGITLGLGTLGLAGGIALAIYVEDLPPGDIALINSGGLWGSFFAGMGALAFQTDQEDTFTALALGADLGLLGMAILSTKINMSRSRSRLIDLGGLLGILAAGGVLATVTDDLDEITFSGTLSAGALVGLGLTTWATSDWDEGRANPQQSSFQLQSPVPFVTPRAHANGTRDTIYGIHLLRGDF